MQTQKLFDLTERVALFLLHVHLPAMFNICPFSESPKLCRHWLVETIHVNTCTVSIHSEANSPLQVKRFRFIVLVFLGYIFSVFSFFLRGTSRCIIYSDLIIPDTDNQIFSFSRLVYKLIGYYPYDHSLHVGLISIWHLWDASERLSIKLQIKHQEKITEQDVHLICDTY